MWEADGQNQVGGVKIEKDSLELTWLKRFATEEDATLTDAQFDRWWSLELQSQEDVEDS